MVMADQRETEKTQKTPLSDLEESLTFRDLVRSLLFTPSPWGCGFPDLEGPSMSRPFPPKISQLTELC